MGGGEEKRRVRGMERRVKLEAREKFLPIIFILYIYIFIFIFLFFQKVEVKKVDLKKSRAEKAACLKSMLEDNAELFACIYLFYIFIYNFIIFEVLLMLIVNFIIFNNLLFII
jgi:fatty acid desaturase